MRKTWADRLFDRPAELLIGVWFRINRVRTETS